jgi:hypothetical protein
MTKAEHEAWMVKLWEAIGPIKSCGACLKSYSETRCPRCGSTQTIDAGRAGRRRAVRDLRRERARRERDPTVIDALRNLYRAQQRHKARRAKYEQV